jgi:HSP20 family protein
MGVKIMVIKREKNNNKTLRSKGKKGEITTWRPYDLWTDMNQLFDSFRSNFDDLFWPWRESSTLTATQRTPPMNIADMGNHYEMRLEMPGIPKDNVDIQVTQNSIEIKAKCDETTEEKGKNWLRRECSGVSYYRAIEFPEDLKIDEVDAEIKDGVLTLNLPKLEPKPSQKPKKINIK